MQKSLKELLSSFSQEDISIIENSIKDDVNFSELFLQKASESGTSDLVNSILATEDHILKQIVKGLIHDA